MCYTSFGSFRTFENAPSTSGFALTRLLLVPVAEIPMRHSSEDLMFLQTFPSSTQQSFTNAYQDRRCAMSAQPKIYTSKTCAWCVGSGRRILSMGTKFHVLFVAEKAIFRLVIPPRNVANVMGVEGETSPALVTPVLERAGRTPFLRSSVSECLSRRPASERCMSNCQRLRINSTVVQNSRCAIF